MLTILTMAAVSAADGNVTSQELAVSEDSIIDSSFIESDEFLGTGEGTFSDLSALIGNTSENGILELDKDYQNKGNESQITISKSITIDGKGHVIDANNASKVFSIVSSTVTLQNIVFKNTYCNDEDGGGAIHYRYDAEGSIINCSFENCHVKDGYGGGAIYFNSAGSAINCNFTNCSSLGDFGGGAIAFESTDEVIRIVNNCIFINCSDKDYGLHFNGGGAISAGNCNISDSIFINCYSDGDGSAISVWGDSVVSNCNFTKCSTPSSGTLAYGGEIGYFTTLVKCNFMDCSAGLYGGGIYVSSFSGPEVLINDCNFTGCLANEGSAVYVDEESIARISNSTFENNKVKSGSVIFGGIIFDCVVNEKTANAINSPNNYAEIIPKNITSNDDGIITITLPSDAKGTLELFIDGNSVAVVEIVKGIAKIDLSKYKDGTFPITFRYSGDENYPGFEKNSTATILFILTRISAPNISVLYAAGQKYLITVYESEGIAARNALVSIKINGKAFNPLYTTALGVASFKVTQVPGTYKLTITSLERTVQSKLTVKHLVSLKSVAVKKSAKKLVLQATLGKVNGKYLKNKKITFKFNGKKYTAKTNKKGVAKVTIKSKVLKKLKVGKKVTYQATYLKDTVKKTVKIKK
ncbi:hypothetical protein [uncultured Methanobrevibacter sp.]|uniref:hypothetical protein n=1 Tax=uncultured Methanobrevibacter sp. TaxID=253161 RepID=UPI0026150F63|nr:hypothetical protein [uncultured Methanobrevibacter sp.]